MPGVIAEVAVDFTWLPQVGSMAAAMVVFFYGLRYVRSRDEDQKEVTARLDGLASKFEATVRDVAAAHDQTIRDVAERFDTGLQRERAQFEQNLRYFLESTNRRTGGSGGHIEKQGH